jgi:nicotinate phosphoribosyltransferase
MPPVISAATSPLLTDLYQLNMLEAYLQHERTETAVFEFFVRKLPARRGFLMAAGLQQAVEFLETLCVSPEELDWLRGSGPFSARTLDWLAELRFAGDVDAVAEGTVVFGNEPTCELPRPCRSPSWSRAG